MSQEVWISRLINSCFELKWMLSRCSCKLCGCSKIKGALLTKMISRNFNDRSFQGVYIIKIVFILLNLYLPKLSYSHECVVEFSKATWHVMRSNLNGMRVCIFLCFLDLSKVASLRFTYVHFQRLSQFGLRISTVFLLAIFGYICLISVTSLSSNKLFIWNPEVLRLT